jgi:hypothetical protein
VYGREEAPGRRVHDQDRLSDRELPRACLPGRRRCVHLDPALPVRLLANPSDGQPAPSVRMRSTPIAATSMTNTASKFARLGSSRSSPVAASNMIPGWACTAGSLSRVSPTALVPPAPHPMGNPRRHPRSLPPLRLRHHLLATPPQHLKLLGVLRPLAFSRKHSSPIRRSRFGVSRAAPSGWPG